MLSLRQAIRCVKQNVGPSIRTISSQSLVNITADKDNEEVAILTLQRPPVNSLNLELLQAINNSLDEIAKNNFKAMILTSDLPNVFSSGLDIMEIYKPDKNRMEQFFSALQDTWLKLFGSGLITAAAINGHSPAGGCLLAISCEYRAMVSGKYRIGLNETALGMVPSVWSKETMLNILPRRECEMAITTGRLFTVDEALKIGLIDEVAKDKDDAINSCKQFIKKFDNISSEARTMTKQKFRASSIQWLKTNKQADLQEITAFVLSPKVQQALEMFVRTLKQKESKSK